MSPSTADEHSHYDPQTGVFYNHEHHHDGPHRHQIVLNEWGLFDREVAGPGNYSPHPSR